MPRGITYVLALSAAAPYAVVGLAPQSPKPVQTADAALAVFKAHCTMCHSDQARSGGLDLSSLEGLKKGGVSGPLFVAGKPDESLLVRRLLGKDGKPQMPMGFVPLSQEKLKAVQDWILAGGPLKESNRKHWSYIAPEKPSPPAVKNSDWPRNKIDNFVLARLEKEGLGPSPEASKETLIRRVSLDLIGLPPTIAEVDAFLKDKSPEAYEKVVDRLLASPHYGERQARIWLDLARYADSDGYEKDLNRVAWKYRDWVIDAFNENMRFDRFTVEQLAGDLLPNATLENLIATGFHRNTMQNLEGGVDQEEAHWKVVLDRTDTTGSVWLGSTLGCAKCHDHKYDPISQKDYFAMAAFYSNAVVIPRGPKEVGEEKWLEPTIEVPTPKQVALKTKLRAELEQNERKLRNWTSDLRQAYSAWVLRGQQSDDWKVGSVIEAHSSGESELKIEGDAVIATGKNPDRDTYRVVLTPPSEQVTGIKLEALSDDSLPGKGPGRAGNGNFVITKVVVKAGGKSTPLARAAADYSQGGFPAQNALLGNERTGWAVSAEFGKSHQIVIDFKDAASFSDPVEVTVEQQSVHPGHNLGKLRISFTNSPYPSTRVLPPDVKSIFERNKRSIKDNERLRAHFLSITPLLDQPRTRAEELRAELRKLQGEIPSALVLKEKPAKGPLTAFLRVRGEFTSKGDLVAASTPSMLPALKESRADRLSLAKWLTSRENPLTARVQVNRMWEQYFGRGIVETLEDFGSQGSAPSHQGLLDWLAVKFMHTGWDMKAVHRLIVTSATYRQSSNATKELLDKDPENRLFARGARFRMEAEMLRDNALAAAGLLSRKIGGPSVYPYQPEGVWNNPFSGERWMTSEGEDAYRRGIYTFIKRTSPYPAFLAFDGTSRETCTVQRMRTNTPLQALNLLNDGGLLAAAKKLGLKMRAGGKSDRQRIVHGFRRCTSRTPKEAELTRLEDLLLSLKEKYRKAPEESKKLAGTPEDSAWTMVANVLLNLDETVTKG